LICWWIGGEWVVRQGSGYYDGYWRAQQYNTTRRRVIARGADLGCVFFLEDGVGLEVGWGMVLWFYGATVYDYDPAIWYGAAGC
jgi:hypothetical protein